MKRPEAHIMEDDSGLLLKNLIDRSWIVRPILKDYGVDYEIEIVDQNVVSGNRIWVQMKSVKNANFYDVYKKVPHLHSFIKKQNSTNQKYLSFPVTTKLLNYALKCPFPLLLFVADLTKKDIWWICLRDYILFSLSKRDTNWQLKKKVHICIPIWNRLSEEKKSGFPSLKWYWLEPSRLYALMNLNYIYLIYKKYDSLSGWEKDELTLGHLAHTFPLTLHCLYKALYALKILDNSGVKEFPKIGIFDKNLDYKNVLKIIKSGIEAAEAPILNNNDIHLKSYSLEELKSLVKKINDAIEIIPQLTHRYMSKNENFILTDINIAQYSERTQSS